MSEEGFEQIVYSRDVLEFVTVANEYCSFIENIDQFKRKDFIVRLQKILPLLYLKTSLLPKVESILDEEPERFMEEEDYNFLHQKLLEKIGQFDSYQEVFDPMIQLSEEPVPQSLAENIADIYQDLKDFLLAYRIGTVEVMNDALWFCIENFENYWGQRLVNGLRHIHMLIVGDQDLNEEEKDQQEEKRSRQNWFLKNHYSDINDEPEE